MGKVGTALFFFYNSAIDRPQREFRCSTLVLNHFDERIFQTIPELFPTAQKKFNASARDILQ